MKDWTKPTNCVDCGQPLNDKNPCIGSGGNLSYENDWSTWGRGACCTKPLSNKTFKQALVAIFGRGG